ncbi:MAG: NADH-quinone oxidoreductase subunit D [Chloroflexota bacterium]|nr:NADH-quinone oxidoreductase subunit D [Chloroflexota bacterium]
MQVATQPYVLNIGPHHPSTHGVFHLRTVLDGEVIVDAEILIGYLHRGIEKLAETRTYTQVIPLTDRFDYLASMTNNLAYCLAVEKLAGIEVPERAQYLRVILAELMRASSHVMSLGFLMNDLGSLFTPLFLAAREREKMLDLFEMLSGQRLLYNFMRIGGVSQDATDLFLFKARQFVDQMPMYLNEIDQLLTENEVFRVRAEGTGALSAEDAINFSCSGPVLRACGVDRDIRRDDPYLIYDRFDFDVITCQNGDNYDRYRVRLGEIWQSLRILDQALRDIPSGEVQAKHPHFLRPPVGEAFSRIEAPKGELGFYLVSDNSIAPYRFHVRSSTLINLTPLSKMLIGWKLADAILTLGSIDIVLGEIDR